MDGIRAFINQLEEMGFFPSIHARTSPLEDAKHDTILEAEIELWQDVEFASTLMLEFPASLQNCEKYISSFFLINYPVKCILLWKQGKTKAHMEKVYISSLSSIFIMRWGLVSLNAFSASNDMIKCQVFFLFCFVFHSVNEMYVFGWFLYIEPLLYS